MISLRYSCSVESWVFCNVKPALQSHWGFTHFAVQLSDLLCQWIHADLYHPATFYLFIWIFTSLIFLSHFTSSSGGVRSEASTGPAPAPAPDSATHRRQKLMGRVTSPSLSSCNPLFSSSLLLSYSLLPLSHPFLLESPIPASLTHPIIPSLYSLTEVFFSFFFPFLFWVLLFLFPTGTSSRNCKQKLLKGEKNRMVRTSRTENVSQLMDAGDDGKGRRWR